MEGAATVPGDAPATAQPAPSSAEQTGAGTEPPTPIVSMVEPASRPVHGGSQRLQPEPAMKHKPVRMNKPATTSSVALPGSSQAHDQSGGSSFITSLKSALSFHAPSASSRHPPKFRAARIHGELQMQEKRGLLNPTWKARNVRLEGVALRIYNSSKNYVEGSHHLGGAVATATTSSKHAQFAVTLTDGTVIHLRAANALDRKNWITAINLAADNYATGVDNPIVESPHAVIRVESEGDLDLDTPITVMEPWHCSLCTTQNDGGAAVCKVCGRSADYVPKSGAGTCNHSFQSHTRLKAMSYYPCAVCNKSISGLLGRCLKCKHCGIMIHKPCLVDAQTGSQSAHAGVFATYTKSFRMPSTRSTSSRSALGTAGASITAASGAKSAKQAARRKPRPFTVAEEAGDAGGLAGTGGSAKSSSTDTSADFGAGAGVGAGSRLAELENDDAVSQLVGAAVARTL